MMFRLQESGLGSQDILSEKPWKLKKNMLESFLPAFRIHLILTWIRIRILGSTFGKSGSGSSDPHLEKVDPDPVPKWIRIRVPIFHIFHKKINIGQIKMLIFLPPKLRKGISQVTKTFSFTFYFK